MNFPTGAMLFCYSAERYRQKAVYFSNIFCGLSPGPYSKYRYFLIRLTILPVLDVINENLGHLSSSGIMFARRLLNIVQVQNLK
jgi:hypothetical protein